MQSTNGSLSNSFSVALYTYMLNQISQKFIQSTSCISFAYTYHLQLRLIMQRWLNPNNTETIFIDDKLSRDKIWKLATLCIGAKLAVWLRLFIYASLAISISN